MKAIVKKMLNKQIETKEITYTSWGNSTSFSYGSGASIAGLYAAIGQGTGESNRIGNRIKGIGAYLRFAIQPADNTNYVRLLVVKAKMAPRVDPSSTASFVQSVLSNTASSSTQWLAPVDTDRFTVLHDKNYFTRFGALDGNSGSTIIYRMIFVNKFIKVTTNCQWDESGVMNNDVWVILLSDSAAIAHPGVVAGFIKSYYKDA